MTIATSVRTAGPYTGTGAVSVYPFAFKVFQASDLLVNSTNTLGAISTLVLSSDYSVTLNADQDNNPGGTINLTAALASGYVLNITSNVPATQSASLTNGGGFFPKVIEGALDRLTILLQQTGLVGVVQSLRVPEIGGIPVLPAAAARANRVQAYDSAGNPVMIVGVDSSSAAALALDLAASGNPAKGTGLLGWLRSLTGAVATTVYKLLGWSNVNALEFFTSAQVTDATGYTGSLDVTAPLQSALDQSSAAKRDVSLNAGLYKTTGLVIPGDPAVYFAGPAANAESVQQVRESLPAETLVPYYRGLIALRREDNAAALGHLQQYAREDPDGATARDVPKTLTLLSSNQLQQEVAAAVARERQSGAAAPEPNSIAVQAFVNHGDAQYRAMAKGLAAMVIADLSKVPGLSVLEREKVQLLMDEAKLGDSGLADRASAVRSGRLMRAEKVIVGNFEVQ